MTDKTLAEVITDQVKLGRRVQFSYDAEFGGAVVFRITLSRSDGKQLMCQRGVTQVMLRSYRGGPDELLALEISNEAAALDRALQSETAG